MKSLLLTSIMLYTALLSQAQNKQIDSLKELLKNSTEREQSFALCRLISWNSMWSYSDTALSYAQQALSIANAQQNTENQAEGYLICGTAWYVTGNYPLAVEHLLKGIGIETQLKKIRINDYYEIPELQLLYYNITDAYIDLNDYEHSVYYYQKAKEVPYNGYDNTIELALHLSRLYEKFNILDSAFYYGKLAYEEDIKIHGRNEREFIPVILIDICYKRGNYPLALHYSRIAQSNDDFKVQYKDAADVYNGMAKTFIELRNLDSSILYVQRAIALQSQISYPVALLNSYTILADIYKHQRNLDSAVKYLDQTIALRDSLFSQQKLKEVQNISFRETLHEQALEAAQQQYRETVKLYTVLGIAIALIVTALLLFRNVQHRKKAYTALQQQKSKTEQALEDLKCTQAQLIQSEKMASLGELTAGIAHEIQNPLNFVNNFSEVNKELTEELQNELKAGDIGEAVAISKDIKENSEKINYHGKRADAIVKGMLQHSRASIGKKEPTDINALCDEYLRLSYHGTRAKDKNFNAEIKTDFDESIGKIIVVPQDIGRVLLNLFNNAFYAVNEKKKTEQENYKPCISVHTKKLSNRIEVRVEDNGNGIPQKAVDKIFQPFFTTKPTGEGTGLGLSLSYDIIKAHGGEIRVETKDGEGTTFKILLPIFV